MVSLLFLGFHLWQSNGRSPPHALSSRLHINFKLPLVSASLCMRACFLFPKPGHVSCRGVPEGPLSSALSPSAIHNPNDERTTEREDESSASHSIMPIAPIGVNFMRDIAPIADISPLAVLLTTKARLNLDLPSSSKPLPFDALETPLLYTPFHPQYSAKKMPITLHDCIRERCARPDVCLRDAIVADIANSPLHWCSKCQQSFSARQALKTHINVKHTHYAIYDCEVCGDVFCDPSARSRCVTRHKGDWGCPMRGCDWTCAGSRFDILQRHVNERHSTETFTIDRLKQCFIAAAGSPAPVIRRVKNDPSIIIPASPQHKEQMRQSLEETVLLFERQHEADLRESHIQVAGSTDRLWQIVPDYESRVEAAFKSGRRGVPHAAVVTPRGSPGAYQGMVSPTLQPGTTRDAHDEPLYPIRDGHSAPGWTNITNDTYEPYQSGTPYSFAQPDAQGWLQSSSRMPSPQRSYSYPASGYAPSRTSLAQHDQTFLSDQNEMYVQAHWQTPSTANASAEGWMPPMQQDGIHYPATIGRRPQ